MRPYHATETMCVLLSSMLQTPEYICICMEYASGGNLFGYVQRAVRLKEPAARWFFQQVCSPESRREGTRRSKQERVCVRVCCVGCTVGRTVAMWPAVGTVAGVAGLHGAATRYAHVCQTHPRRTAAPLAPTPHAYVRAHTAPAPAVPPTHPTPARPAYLLTPAPSPPFPPSHAAAPPLSSASVWTTATGAAW